MQPKTPRLLFSNLLKKCSQLPKSPIMDNPPPLCSLHPLTSVHFSSIPNRPMRGDRRRDGDGSEDKFLRNLNFGGERDRPSRLPNRPLRGEERPMRRERREGADRFNQNDGERVDGSMEINEEQAMDQFNFGEETQVSASDPSVPETPPEDADGIFKKMKETGLIPNAVAMLDGLCKDGLVQEAMKLFGLMREKGTIPEVVIYTAVVEGFCKATKFDDAKRIFRKMQKNGIVPNAFSYGVVIQGLCRGKRLEDAVEFVKEMQDAGHSPNAATLTVLVQEFCVEKGVEEAASFVRSLRERGFAIDEKAVREYLDKKGPSLPMVWEAIFGKKDSQRPF